MFLDNSFGITMSDKELSKEILGLAESLKEKLEITHTEECLFWLDLEGYHPCWMTYDYFMFQICTFRHPRQDTDRH